MDDQIYTFFQLDQNEYRLSDEGEHAYAWDAQGWIGTDYDKLFLKSVGEQPLDGQLEEAEVQLLYSRLFYDSFDAQVGVRYRSEEHTSELQSLMRHSYAVLCLTTKHTAIRIKYKLN